MNDLVNARQIAVDRLRTGVIGFAGSALPPGIFAIVWMITGSVDEFDPLRLMVSAIGLAFISIAAVLAIGAGIMHVAAGRAREVYAAFVARESAVPTSRRTASGSSAESVTRL